MLHWLDEHPDTTILIWFLVILVLGFFIGRFDLMLGILIPAVWNFYVIRRLVTSRPPDHGHPLISFLTLWCLFASPSLGFLAGAATNLF